jgi:succinate dehydrogenase/fumarate reductase flavoprotein subunit
MAYGAAFLIAKSFKIFLDPSTNPTCAVIGSGISGLMTAIELTKSGRLVTIYSEVIPQFNQNDSSKLLASQSLPQVWMPNDYDWSEDELKHELISKMSYDFYKVSNSLKRYQSIKKMTVYDR